ncbi:VOC family protein [Pimelobacter simplex]|uniref:VOC family protein n=1 Tax=Nocardioides simplex TaxID=2045 RepID=UPI00214FDFB7|nr:VOC family protein [Pimelobacter simplex]UUW91090.1 VOC family protein [Pimelobacter simplex]UUW94918.1 VOC family protein [Pimelobacter simplex]
MKITSSAISLNVPDPAASARFAAHLGFTEEMSADGFISLGHPSAGVNVIFLRTGLASFKPARIAGDAGQGTLLAFVVDGLDAEFERISAAGATVVTPPETEPWGERFCQFSDDNGIVWQLVEWVS